MTEKTKKLRKQLIILTLLYGVGVIFFMTTNPSQLPLLLLIIPFAYIFVVLYLTILFIARLLGVRRALPVAFIISIFGVLLLVLGSLHQLTMRDALISLALTSLLTWYISRSSNRLTG